MFTPRVLRVYTKYMKHKNNFHSQKQELHPDTFLFSTLTLLIVVILAFVLTYLPTLQQKNDRAGACTEETRVCPGGSLVSRTGPNCDFTRCPRENPPSRPGITEEPFDAPLAPPQEEPVVLKEKPTLVCTDVVKLCPDGSFVGKVGKNCEFAPCPDDLESESDR